MTEILGRIAKADHYFRPQTGSAYFALQLARKLNDLAQVRMYLHLTERHSQPILLDAFRNARRNAVELSAKRFSCELRTLTGEGANE